MLTTKSPIELDIKTGSLKVKIKKASNVFSDKSSEGIVIVNSFGIVQNVNPGLQEMFAYEKNELIGQNINLLIPDIDKFYSNIEKREFESSVIDSQENCFKLNGRVKDNSKFSLDVSMNHFNVGGQKMTMILIKGVAEVKQPESKAFNANIGLEQQIGENGIIVSGSQYLIEMIAKNFPNGVISILDRDFNYVYLGGLDLKKSELSGELKDGNSFLNRIDPAKRFNIRKKLLGVFEGKNSSFEVAFDDKIYMVNAVGLKVLNRSIKQILIVTQNISHLKKTEEDILHSLEKEKQSNERKSQFVSMATHEFRTPLTTILNSTALLSKLIDIEGSEQGVQKQVNRIKSTINLLNNILNDYMSLGRIDDGKIEMKISNINLPEYTSEVLEELQGISKAGQKIEYQHKGSDMALIDSDMLKNIYHNLISNAIKYSAENDVIRIETSIENNQLKLIVQDSGIGIPREEQKNMFERFFRASNVKGIKGTGLGLSIVKRYVELVDGNIKFFSIPNKGTTFIVDIPLQNSKI